MPVVEVPCGHVFWYLQKCQHMSKSDKIAQQMTVFKVSSFKWSQNTPGKSEPLPIISA